MSSSDHYYYKFLLRSTGAVSVKHNTFHSPISRLQRLSINDFMNISSPQQPMRLASFVSDKRKTPDEHNQNDISNPQASRYQSHLPGAGDADPSTSSCLPPLYLVKVRQASYKIISPWWRHVCPWCVSTFRPSQRNAGGQIINQREAATKLSIR